MQRQKMIFSGMFPRSKYEWTQEAGVRVRTFPKPNHMVLEQAFSHGCRGVQRIALVICCVKCITHFLFKYCEGN